MAAEGFDQGCIVELTLGVNGAGAEAGDPGVLVPIAGKPEGFVDKGRVVRPPAYFTGC